jgi:hypothetical protein
MRLYSRSKPCFESLRCVLCTAADPNVEEWHDPAGWPSSALKYRAPRLRKAGVLRLCCWCLTARRRCNDSRRSHTFKSWKAYRRHQWAVGQ